MAITRIQAPSPSHATAVETINLSWTSPTTAGNLLLGVLQGRENIHSVVGPTGMTLLAEQVVGTSERQFIYYEQNCSVRSGSQTFSFSQTSGSDVTMHLVEYSGLKTSGAFDLSAMNTGTSTTPDSGTTGTTGAAVELWFAALCNRNVGTQGSPTNGFTQVNVAHSTNASAGKQLEGAIYEKIVSATGTANVGATLSPATARDWGGIVVTLKGTDSNTVDVTTAGKITHTGMLMALVPQPGVITHTGQVVTVGLNTIIPVTGGVITHTGQVLTLSSPATSEPPLGIHEQPGGWPQDPRQRRFLYHRPPFVQPKDDPRR